MTPQKEPIEIEAEPVLEEAEAVAVPAAFHFRFMAFFMDVVLVLSVVALLYFQWIVPTYFPKEWALLQQEMDNYAEAVADAEAAGETPPEPPRPELMPELQTALLVYTLLFPAAIWVYFATSLSLFSGTTLGKRTFNLRVIARDGSPQLGFVRIWLRSGLSALFLLVATPFGWINFILPAFNKNRLTGHDYLSKTMVIKDRGITLKKRALS